MQESLIFLVSAPRSGSTLLARMLGAHSAIAAGPEAHLITPLAHLGFFERVDAAPYDPVISQEGIRELVARLPAGEESYVEACRAYADVLYARFLETQPGCSRVLDKTPAYALVLPFLARLYPRARYVVLTRTPPAVLASQATSFFDGDFATAVRHSPVLERYVPAIARFLRERPVDAVHVRYEDLVSDPGAELGRICEYLELPFEDAVIEYGRAEAGAASVTGARGLGDPNVTRHARPVTDFLESWITDIAGDPERLRITRDCLAGLDPRDVETWGYSMPDIEDALEKADAAPAATRRPRLTRFHLERKLLVALRRNIHTNWLGRVVRRVRLYCDVLLR